MAAAATVGGAASVTGREILMGAAVTAGVGESDCAVTASTGLRPRWRFRMRTGLVRSRTSAADADGGAAVVTAATGRLTGRRRRADDGLILLGAEEQILPFKTVLEFNVNI